MRAQLAAPVVAAQSITTQSNAATVIAHRVSPANRTHQAHAVREILINRWRLQRIEVRRLLLQVLSGELLTYSHAEQSLAMRALCSELVDYVSTGHFEIYGRILPRKLHADADVHDLLQHIFHSIGKSTDAVLSFNDRFQHGDDALLNASFGHLLPRLSRGLLLRFALDEQLLELCNH